MGQWPMIAPSAGSKTDSTPHTGASDAPVAVPTSHRAFIDMLKLARRKGSIEIGEGAESISSDALVGHFMGAQAKKTLAVLFAMASAQS